MSTATVECRICLQKVASAKGLATHLNHRHQDQSVVSYYRKFLAGPKEGVCGYCGAPTKFVSLTKGFHRFCSVVCARNSPEVIARREATNLAVHGAAYYTQAPAFQDQARATRHARYGDVGYNNVGKQRETMLARHGKAHAWSGPAGTRSCDNTKLERYGDSTYANHEQGRATRLRLYGDAHFNRNACRATNLERYGVEWPLQNAAILEKNHSFRYYDYALPSGGVVRVQGYERYALDWLLQQYEESDILVSKGRVPPFWYTFEGKSHRYFPDAFVVSADLVMEVKSEYTLKASVDVTRAKLLAVIQAGYQVQMVVVTMRKGTSSLRLIRLSTPDDVLHLG